MATKWGIISAGKISHDFAVALSTLPVKEHQIVAVAARRSDDAQAFSEKFKIPNWYGSYNELAENTDIEVVYIGNININHYPLGRLMLQHGKHVLMEKPFCLSLEESEELMDFAKKRKLFLMEALWSRFLPAYVYMMKELKAGTVGNVIDVSCSLGYPFPGVDNLRRKDLGGGALMNMGIYCLSAIAMVYDHEWPEKICAVGHLNDEGVDETVTVTLQYSKGRVASFTTSFTVQLPCELHISGSKQMLKLSSPMCAPSSVHLGDQKKDFHLPHTDFTCKYSDTSVGLGYEAVEVRQCLREGLLESSSMSHSHTKHLQKLMGEILRQLGVDYPVFKKYES